jgi:hypothetical protein
MCLSQWHQAWINDTGPGVGDMKRPKAYNHRRLSIFQKPDSGPEIRRLAVTVWLLDSSAITRLLASYRWLKFGGAGREDQITVVAAQNQALSTH